MTHSGGQPHPVGYRGQRYEVTYFDANSNQRKVFGWSDCKEGAQSMARCIELHPSMQLPTIRDREAIVVDRAISLTQPWATLMGFDKLVETRSWKTSYRGWLAIHASLNFPPDARERCLRQPFLNCLAARWIRTLEDLPLGCVVAVAHLDDCWKTEALRILSTMSAQELAFGNYDDRRYGFMTSRARRLREPIPMKGALSIWKMPRPITEEDLI